MTRYHDVVKDIDVESSSGQAVGRAAGLVPRTCRPAFNCRATTGCVRRWTPPRFGRFINYSGSIAQKRAGLTWVHLVRQGVDDRVSTRGWLLALNIATLLRRREQLICKEPQRRVFAVYH